MNNLIPLVTENNGQPITTSRAVAEQFGKRHIDVLRAIENSINKLNQTDEGKEFTERNFALSDYTDNTGRNFTMYVLTRDGFALLAMGFTGDKAMQFKVAYINAFNRMENLLKNGISTDKVIELEQRLSALESETTHNTDDLNDIGNIFLSAINDSLQSGAYHIYDKTNKTADYKGERLGIVYGGKIALHSKVCYELYTRAVSKPLSKQSLYAVLRQCKVIENADNNTDLNIEPHKRVSVLFVDCNRIKYQAHK